MSELTTIQDEPKRSFLHRTIPAWQSFMALMGAWLLLIFLLRIGEWVLNGYTHQFPEKTFSFLFFALLADLVFLCKAGLLLLILFTAISSFSIKAARIVFIIAALLLTLSSVALQKYFNSSLVLLGADLYGYSWKDIQQTVGASGGLNLVSMIAGVVLIILVLAVFKWVSRKIYPGKKTSFALLIVLLAVGFFSLSFSGPQPSFKKEYDNNLAQNKLDYFFHASYLHFFPETFETDIYSDAYSGSYADIEGGNELVNFHYTDEKQFPFLHSDSSADVLSPFLKKGNRPPNIVIILVEGLGRAFTNQGAYLGNFTPFLDSLSGHSLYWENFLSGGGRTFAVLPSVLGSLPFGQNGFNALGDKMPAQLSLTSIARKNGYYTSFYYAGNASFDNMDIFMKHQGTDNIFDKQTFPAGYTLLPSNNGFTWGYGDKELYRYFMANQGQRNANQPTLQVLLTVSTHSPFLVNQQAQYDAAVEQRMNVLQFTEEQKAEHRAYKSQYATVLYADDALRDFFNAYSKTPAYSNTIFLITGDHRMPEIPMASKVDRYHVPLILYSPMLERPTRFKSISTHFDITPSLLAYLKSSFNHSIPAVSSWMGSGLDTARGFRNIHPVALMQTKTDLLDFVMGNYHLNGTDVFKLTPTMGEEKVNDEAVKQNLQAAFSQFQQRNDKFIKGAALWPDSIIQQYRP